VFDVVNAITIQGLETRPTDSFALLVFVYTTILQILDEWTEALETGGRIDVI